MERSDRGNWGAMQRLRGSPRPAVKMSVMCKLGPTCRHWMTREAEMLDERNGTKVENGTPSFFLNSREEG
jgi:hypothetical protein